MPTSGFQDFYKDWQPHLVHLDPGARPTVDWLLGGAGERPVEELGGGGERPAEWPATTQEWAEIVTVVL